jgi:hypothetical protein
MKRIGSIAVISLLAMVGCDNTSRLDRTTKVAPKDTPTEAAPGPAKADHSGTLEERVARIEGNLAKYGEALEFLQKVYAQQKQQQQAQEREEAAPDAMFAVDITPDVKLGMVEGSPQALVTIVEAWDFA